MAVAMITGASSGVGFELTHNLLVSGWDVIALIRSDMPSHRLIQDGIKAGKLRTVKADLSDFRTLGVALQHIKKTEHTIDVLFNNAGVGLPTKQYSRQGREMHYEVNTIAPYIILNALKPLLLNGTLRTVINTSSNALLTVKAFDPSNLARPVTFKKLFGPYASSKLALSLWTFAVAAEIQREGIEIRSVCPGPNKTTMTASDGMPTALRILSKILFRHPAHGAQQLLNAAQQFTGTVGIFINRGKEESLKFKEHAPTVLADARAIYENEFLK